VQAIGLRRLSAFIRRAGCELLSAGFFTGGPQAGFLHPARVLDESEPGKNLAKALGRELLARPGRAARSQTTLEVADGQERRRLAVVVELYWVVVNDGCAEAGVPLQSADRLTLPVGQGVEKFAVDELERAQLDATGRASPCKRPV
jgi:hypothetical protein